MPLVTDAKKVSLTKPKLNREAKFVSKCQLQGMWEMDWCIFCSSFL